MFERFTDNARNIVVQAQQAARRLDHNYIGCEHLLLAVTSSVDPVAAVLRDHGVTPDRVEAEILRTIGRGRAADPLGNLDREALAAIGIDLDVVRARIEAAFGPDALTRAILAHRGTPQACRPSRRPAWGKGPIAHLMRRRRARRGPAGPARPGGHLPPPGRHIPFTARAKKTMEISLREANALDDNYIGPQHLALALLAMKDGMVPTILSALGTSSPALRAAILDRYRKAS